jgi:hypothetical protein
MASLDRASRRSVGVLAIRDGKQLDADFAECSLSIQASTVHEPSLFWPWRVIPAPGRPSAVPKAHHPDSPRRNSPRHVERSESIWLIRDEAVAVAVAPVS